MDASEWLEAAADYIEEHGWVRVELEHAGRVCLVGSLFKTLPGRVMFGTMASIETEEPLRFVASELGIGTDGVPRSRWWTEIVRCNEKSPRTPSKSWTRCGGRPSGHAMRTQEGSSDLAAPHLDLLLLRAAPAR
jgi:hypothetical protein